MAKPPPYMLRMTQTAATNKPLDTPAVFGRLAYIAAPSRKKTT